MVEHVKKSINQYFFCQVRITMARQLSCIARKVEPDLVPKRVLPELVELTEDEKHEVRAAAWDAMIDMLDALPADSVKSSIIPIVSRCTKEPPPGLEPLMCRTMGNLIFKLGRAMLELYPNLLANIKELCTRWVVSHGPGKGAAATDSLEMRRLVAWNMPAIVSTLGTAEYESFLKPMLNRLVEDNAEQVRCTIACALTELVGLLGPQAGIEVANMALSRLLRDKAKRVACTAIKVSASLITRLAEAVEARKALGPLVMDTVRGIVDFHRQLENSVALAFSLLTFFFSRQTVLRHKMTFFASPGYVA